MRANLNNTHSGNMSCRDPRDAGRFWITASGSACGHLSPADLVAVRFADLGSEGPARPSSEANTHRRVLELPGANACVHCHAVASTLLGFESPRNPIFLLAPDPPRSDSEEYLFQPVDVWGAGLIGAVTVGVYQDTVGSLEMEQRIPAHLGRAPVAIVKAHGPFARGQSLEECLHYVGVLEFSATVAIALRRRGVDTLALQRALRAATPAAVFAWPPRPLDGPARAPEPAADPASRCEFDDWLSYNFDLGLGAFGTGSLSRKRSADEMLFCPMSAAPPGIEADLRRIPLRPQGPESEAADVRLHRLIYTRTPYTACMVAASPLATAEAMAALAAVAGVEALAGRPGAIARSAAECPIVAPIDAESTYHQIRLPVTSLRALALDAEGDLVSGLLQSGKGACLVAGGGVIAAGERSLAQAAYRVALAERVARFRQEVDLHHRMLGGPPAAAFE
jgi:L-fuculose-phosphate aldolase